MSKEERYQIILSYAKSNNFTVSEIAHIIDLFVLDELMYAGLKAYSNKADVSEEFRQVLDAYSFAGYSPSLHVQNYIKHYSANPQLAAMQHYDLNDYVSYIGEYYDGTPTRKHRKEGRYEIVPIALASKASE